MAIISLGSEAQSSFSQTSSNPTGAILNTSVDTMNFTMSGTYYPVIGFQVTVTRLTGTMAGTAVLVGSIDGVNFVAAGADTLTMTNSTTNTKVWKLEEPIYKYYRIKVGGATTVTGTSSAKLFALKP